MGLLNPTEPTFGWLLFRSDLAGTPFLLVIVIL